MEIDADVVDCVVIGAGVVGLAVARAIALSPKFAGKDLLVLEAASAIGTGTSSRNSEVIHAGIYYPDGSLKARLCVQGRAMLRMQVVCGVKFDCSRRIYCLNSYRNNSRFGR